MIALDSSMTRDALFLKDESQNMDEHQIADFKLILNEINLPGSIILVM